MDEKMVTGFSEAARRVGAEVVRCTDVQTAVRYIHERAGGKVLLPEFPSAERLELRKLLTEAGSPVESGGLRASAPTAAAGVTGANFALADTGTVVLESTREAIRLASTLPERHFILLDPRKIIADGPAAVPLLRELDARGPRSFYAWITGPSRTADIERVLTIGVHGPRELHILLVEGMSGDPLEM